MQSYCVRSFGRTFAVLAALWICAPSPDAYAAEVQKVQSGTAVNNANGTQTVAITSIDTTKSILIFQARSNGNRPVNSEVRGRIASATSIEFIRVTNEGAPATIDIQWYVATFGSGVNVQRGEVTQSGAACGTAGSCTNVAITAVASLNQAFVLWSKTAVAADLGTGADDAILGELTTPTNLQFRANMVNAGHTISWQVVEFTNAADINVQKGSITTMTGAITAANATLGTPVDVSHTFVLVGVRTTDGSGPDIGAKMVRAQLSSPTNIAFDRGIGTTSDVTEIVWQAVELKDGSQVWSGTANFAVGVASATPTLGNVINTTRAVGLISTQGGGGQNTGRTAYVGDDLIGVGAATVALTTASNQITLTRNSTVAVADVAFSVIQFNGGSPFKVGSFTKSTGGTGNQIIPHGLGQIPKALIVWTEGRTDQTFSNATGITFRAAASVGTVGATGVHTLTVAKPTGTTVNDVMLASIAARPNTAVLITPPAGWTLIRRTNNGGAAFPNLLATYWKLATAAEPANYAWSFDRTTNGLVGGIASFSGVDTTLPVDVDAGQNTPSGFSHPAPSVTTTMANDMIVTAHSFASADTWNLLPGMSQAVNVTSVASTNPVGQALQMNYVLQPGVGASGIKTATVTAPAGDEDEGNAQTFALRPATPAYFGYGMTDGTTSKSLSASSQNYANTANAASKIANKVLTIAKWDGTGITLAEADLFSWDDTNITLNWTTNDTFPYVIHFVVMGGTDLSAKVLSWTMRTTVGNQAVTGVGFQPNLVIHAHGGYLQTAAPPAYATPVQRAAFGLGAMDGENDVVGGYPPNQWATQIFTPDALGTADTQRGQATDAAILSFNEALTVQKKASFVSMNADGFTLNFTNTTSNLASQVFSLALKGLNAKVGNFTKSTAAAPVSQPITGVNFEPAVMLFTSVQDVAQATPVAEARYGIGASDGTNEASSAFFDQNGAGVTNAAGIDKTSKAFMKVNNTTPAIDAEANVTSMDPDGFTLNWTTNDGAATQILYLALAPMAVTEVKLTSFTAAKYNSGVLVQWRTGYEIDNLGFNVYRERNGQRVKLNASLISGSGLQSGRGAIVSGERTYARWDLAGEASDPTATYWLEDVEFDGKSTFHGPISPVVNSLQAPSTPDSDELGGNPAANDATIAARRIFFNYNPDPVTSGPRAQSPQVPAEVASQWALAANAPVKIGIRKPGWYRVTQPELVVAGLSPSVNPHTLQLFVDGTEQSIRVTGESDGTFDPSDAIEFYGAGTDTPFTDTRTYWLQAGSQSGRRIAVDAGASSAPTTLTGFSSTLLRKDRVVYSGAIRNGDTENWFGPGVLQAPATPDPDDPWAPVNLTLTTNHIDLSAGTQAQLTVALQGVTSESNDGEDHVVGARDSENHIVGVLVNGTDVGQITFGGESHKVQTLPVSLIDGENIVTLEARGGAADISLVDAIRVDYPHSYQADADRLRLTAAGGASVTIGGFASSSIRVFDITDRTTPVELPATLGSDAGLSTVTVNVPGTGPRTLMAFSDETVATPAFVKANLPSSLHGASNAYDYVMISHRDFVAKAAALATWRQTQGHLAVVVDVEDIYDEFSFGQKTPQAIRDFLQWAKIHWTTAPRFVVLVGDATIDPRDYEGLGDNDFVPTKQVPMNQVSLETASDDWFVDFADNGLPEVAIGRLSVRTETQAEAMVGKIIAYDQTGPQPWMKNVLLVADRNNGTTNFEQATQTLAGLVPAAYTAQRILRDSFGTPPIGDDLAVTQAITNQVNAGQLIVNYVGHGSDMIWGGTSQILNNGDIASWTNAAKLPFVVAMNCLNGLFQGVWEDASLAEAMQRAPNGGAVAVWASSSTTPPATQVLVNQELFRLIFGGEYATLGGAVAAAKRVVVNTDLRRSWIFFGDPAMHLMDAPRPSSGVDPTLPPAPTPPSAPVDPTPPIGDNPPGSVVNNLEVTADSVSPNAGAGASQTFALHYSDTAGATNVATAWVWVNATFASTVTNTCLAYYDQAANQLALLNDAGTAWSSGVVGSAGILQNSQCAVSLVSSTATPNGTTLTVNLSLTLQPGFGGTKSLYLYALGASGASSGWQTRGTWTVPSTTVAVTANAVSPNAGAGTSQVFALHYADSAGATRIANAWVWFNPTLATSAANSCAAYYDVAASQWLLLNDGGTAWTGATVGTLQNSQCAFDVGGSTIVRSGNTLTLGLPVTFKPGFAGLKNIYLYAANVVGASSGWQTRGTWMVPGGTLVVTADTVTPNAGTGPSQTFALQYSDTAGAADLTTAWVWFNATFASASTNTCMVNYDRAGNIVSLLNDAATAWMPADLGSGGTLQNSQCTIDPGASAIALNGNVVTLNLAMTFKPGFSGTKTVYMYASNSGGTNSGWQTRGSWTVPSSASVGTVVVGADAVTPNAGAGASQTFALRYSDTAGALDLAQTSVLFNSSLGSVFANSCKVSYDRAANTVSLLNDAGTSSTSATIGSGVTLQNAQCAIAPGSSTVVLSGNTLTLNLATTFKLGFAGAKNIYMEAVSAGGANSGWQSRGAWTVPGGTVAVTADSVSPNAGTGTNQTFALQYTDTAGATDLTTAWVWISTSFGSTAAGSCLVYYDRAANVLSLLNDQGTAWTPAAVGGSGVLQNSQCAMALSGTTAVLSGTTLTLNLSMTFTPGFVGTKQIYMYAVNAGGTTSGWQTRGSWTVSGSAVVVTADAVSPNAGAGAAQTFMLQYSDTAGATDLTTAWVWFTPTFSSTSANSCLVYHDRAANLISLLNDAGTAWMPAAPMSGGTLQNGQCSLALDGTTTVTLNGSAMTLSLSMTFSPAFNGAKNIYMFATNGRGAASGWQTRGAWTIP